MATNEYSADDRQLGILLLANAPWGGADVYVRLYRLGLDDEGAVRTAAVRAIGLHGSPDDAARIASARRSGPVGAAGGRSVAPTPA